MKRLLLFVILSFSLSFVYGQYINESFEGTLPPSGWLVLNNGSGNDWTQNTTSAYAHTGTKSAMYVYNSSNAADTWLFTSGVTLANGETVNWEFYERVISYNYPENLKFTVGTAQDVASQTTTLIDLPGLTNTTYALKSGTFTAPAAGTYYFALNCYSEADQWNLYVDDVKIETPPTCPAPSALTATNITATSADIGWTAGGSETAWEYVYGLSPLAAPGGAGTATPNNPTTLSGLTSGTTYQFYVRANCGGGSFSTWAGPHTFSTLPANDNCSGALTVTVNADLNCGTVTHGTTTGATASTEDPSACSGTEDDDVWFSFTATQTTHKIDLLNVAGSTTDLYHSVWEGTCGSLTLLSGSCSDPNSSSPSGLTPGNTYFIRIYTWTSSGGQTTSFDVCVGTFPPPPANDLCANATTLNCGSTDIAGTTTGATDNNPPSCNGAGDGSSGGVWYTFVGTGNQTIITVNADPGNADDLDNSQLALYTGSCASLVCEAGNDDNTPPGDGGSQITFSSVNGTTYYVYVDGYSTNSGDFLISLACITCPAPTALTATNITTTTADIGWTAGGSETAWEYVYGVSPLPAPSGSGTATSSNPTTLSGLSANTTYQFYVRANCGSEFSNWSGPHTFTTSLAPGTCGFFTVDLLDDFGDGWNGGTLDVYINGALYYNDLTLASGSGPESHQIPVDIGDILSFDFTAGSYPGENQYIVYDETSTEVANEGAGGATPGDIGDPNIPSGLTACASCAAPTALTATNITATTADIGWTVGGSETAWEYSYGVSPHPAPGGAGIATASNPTALSGLTSGTTYQFYVRANCGGGSFSTWAGPQTFSTLPANDLCSNATDLGTLTSPYTGTTAGANDDDLQTCSGGNICSDIYFYIDVPDGQMLTIGQTTNGYDSENYVGYGGDCGTGTLIDCFDDPDTKTVTWNNCTGSTQKVYWVQDGYSSSTNYFGSFTLAWSLSAVPPPATCGAGATSPADGATDVALSGDITWASVAGATNYDVYLDTNNPPTTLLGNTATTTIPYSGLNFSTPYYLQIVAKNCGGSATGCVVTSFTTVSADAVDWCNLQHPPSATITAGETFDAYARVYEPGVTDAAGQGAGITAWIGYNTGNTDPSTWTNWVAATYNVDAGNNDEYKATLGTGIAPGTYYYASRFKLNGGQYKYGGYSGSGGGFWNGTTYESGVLTVNHVAGDLCTNAISLPVGEVCTNTQGTNANASPSGELPNPTCSSFGNGTDNWYSIVVPNTGNVTVEMSSAGGPTDWGMSIYSGACGSLTQVACDDDSGEGAFPKISLTGQTSGNTLYVRVFEYGNNQTGAFNICAKKDCPATMTVLAASATSTSSTNSCVDGAGWTHYLDNSNNLLLSLKLGSSGAVISGVTVDPDGATDAVYVLNDIDGFPLVNGASGGAFMKRKWNVNAGTQPSSDVTVRHYYTIEEYNAVNSEISAPANGSGTPLTSQNQLNFYKVLNGMDPFNIGPGGIAIGDIALITHGAAAGINTWVDGTATGGFYAEYLVAGFSGGGGGGGSNGALLPLELLSFTGTTDKDVNILNWKTVNEVNTDKFVVERSIDGSKWEYVADVNASGNSRDERSYTATDEKPYSLSYYRLKMMDRDGRYSYSKNISIERKDNTFRLYSVSPNPNNGNFAVTFNSIGSGKTNLVVVNALGMKVYVKSIDTNAGTNNEFLDIANLTDGIYTLILEQDGQIVTQRMVINK